MRILQRLSLDARRSTVAARTAEDIAPRASPGLSRVSATTAVTVRPARVAVDERAVPSPPLRVLTAAGDTRALAERATLFEVDCVDQHGRTALHVAAALGNVACTHVLLRAGASVNLPDGMHCTALLVAAAKGHWAVCEALLEGAADPTICGGSVQAEPVDYLYDASLSSAEELVRARAPADCFVFVAPLTPCSGC